MDSVSDLSPVPLVKLLHAVFHRTLVGTDFVFATFHQRPAPGVHAFTDLVVLNAGFHVGRLLGLDKLSLESLNFFRVVELHHVERLVDAARVQGRDRQDVRVPLDHDVRVIRQPDRSIFARFAFTVAVKGSTPALVDGRAGMCAGFGGAYRLHRIVLVELPAQVIAGHQAAKTWMKWDDVVVLQIDLDEGLLVVIALVQFDPVEHKTAEIEIRARAHASQVGVDIAAVVFE